MWRAANFAVAAVALFAGVILAWAGGVGGQRDLSETHHVNEMRARLDALRARYSSCARTWTT